MTKILEREKSQTGRLHSIFIFSGIMIWMSTKNNLTELDRAILFISGSLVALTVGKAYIINKKRIDNVR